MQSDVSDLMSKIQALKTQRDCFKETIDNMNEVILSKQNDNGIRELELNIVRSRIENLKTSNENTENLLKNNTTQLKEIYLEYETSERERRSLADKNDSLETENSMMTSELKKLKDLNEELDNGLKIGRRNKEIFEGNTNRLEGIVETKKRDFQKVSSELDHLCRDFNSNNLTFELVSDSLENLIEHVDRLKTEMGEVDWRNLKYEEVNGRIEDEIAAMEEEVRDGKMYVGKIKDMYSNNLRTP